MELTAKQKAIKYFSYCLIILLADLLQNTPGLFPQIFGARCFLLLPVAVILAMSEDMIGGALIGLFAGLLWDVSGAVHLGFNCIYITVICLLTSVFVTYIARDTFITNMISCTTAIVVYCLLYWLCFMVLKKVQGAQITILTFYIPCAIYTAACTPIIWLVLKQIKKKLKIA